MSKTGLAEAATHDDRPNILLIAPHDCGRELGCYGRQAHTPQLDALAEEGAVLEDHFCTSASCAPSRASISTGLMPHNHGMIGHPFHSSPQYTEEAATVPQCGWEIHEGTFTLPMYLNRREYETYLVGNAHTSKETLGHRHYPKHPDPNGAPQGARNMADVVEEILDEEATTEQPFYIETKLANAHHPYSNRPGGFKDDPLPGYDGPAPEDIDLSPYFPEGVEGTPEYDEATVRQEFADFYEDMYELDYAMGRIIEALEATGQRQDTVVIVTADHGIPLRMAPRAKMTNYDRGTEAAAIVHYPDRIEGGDRHDTLTSHVDILPTVLDLVDGRPPYDVDGRSLRPLLDAADDRAYEERDAVFVETTYNGRPLYDPVRGIRTEEFKLLRNCWPHEYAWSDREPKTEVELYDLQEDPHETTNRADDPAYAPVREELYSQLRARLERDHDSILDGPIPPLQGGFDVRI